MEKILYKDKNASIKKRVEDLLPRMTLEEKVAQLGCMTVVQDAVPQMDKIIPHGIGTVSANVSLPTPEENAVITLRIQKHCMENTRLGIPALIHCEALQGVIHAGATVFPAAIGLAATWEPEIVEGMGDVIRHQAKAIGMRQILSPVMDVARDMRWGRVNESYGESPTLCAAMSRAFVKGVQTDDLSEGVVATGKHFIGYGFTEGGINMTQAHITERELREVFAKPFQAAITEANLASVMNCYNTIDGEPVVGSARFLTELLRDEMRFNGITVSDYMSLERMVAPLNFAKDMADAAMQCLKAGLDQEMPNYIGYGQPLIDAVNAGNEEIVQYIDRSVRRVLHIKFALGLFDRPYHEDAEIRQFYGRSDYEEKSKAAAAKSVVLVKNERGILPLDRKAVRKLAIIGPSADNIRALFPAYTQPAQLELLASKPAITDKNPDHLLVTEIIPGAHHTLQAEDPTTNDKMRRLYPGSCTLFDQLASDLTDAQVVTAPGCDFFTNDHSQIAAAVELAKSADTVILAVGGRNGWGKTTNTIGEGLDSCKIGLCGAQHDLAMAILDVCPDAIILHMNGRPLCDEALCERAHTLVEAWCPGPHGPEVLSDILFGKRNPGGKLPITAARYVGQVPVYAEHQQGSGYEPKKGLVLNHDGYMDGICKPIFYFGHGLSYTKFAIGGLRLESEHIPGNGVMHVSVNVQNVGEREGDEVVQLYVRDMIATVSRPVKELVGFKRVSLLPGEKQIVEFTFPLSQISFLDRDMKWKVESGEMKLMVGSSSEDIAQEAMFNITSDAYFEGATRGFVADAQIK